MMNEHKPELKLKKLPEKCCPGVDSLQQTNTSEKSRWSNSDLLNTSYLDCLLNYGNIPIIAWNPELKITLFNRTIEHMTGISANEILSHPIEILLPVENREKALSLIRSAATGEMWESVEIDILGKDGDIRTILWNSAPLYNNDGSTPAVIATIAQGQDITELKQSEETLSESETRFRALFDQASDAILLIATDTGAIVEFNDSAHKNLGYTYEEFRHLNICDIEVVESIEETTKHIVQIPQTGEDTFITRHKMKNGDIRNIRASARVISLSGKQFILSIWHDITESKRAESALKAANDRLIVEQEALKEKNVALKEIFNQIENEKKQTTIQIQSNIDRIVMPLLRKLKNQVNPALSNYISLIQDNLAEITSQFVNKLEACYIRLSPREVEICNMIKNGMTSKEICSILNTSEGTVRNQRKNIRKKLGIANKDTNLRSYLQTM